jgi:adenosylcobyric acid synthase
MGFARAADVPVVMIGDIERGGVIASLVGTKAVLDPADAALIEGFIVNRMRGDPGLFAPGMAAIAARTGWAPLGLVPHLPAAARLPAEDSMALPALTRRSPSGGRVRIAVPLLPWIANFDDLDPLAAEPDVELIAVPPGEPLPAPCDLVILPGSKATIADLAALRAEGWDTDLLAHWRRGGRILGLCGGYQMLGRRLHDPDGIEGPPGEAMGLGLLAVETVLGGDKTLRAVAGVSLGDGLPIHGYEMHVGRSSGPDCARPLLRLDDGRPEGATSADGLVAGSYVHGFFAADAQRRAWIARLGGTPGGEDFEAAIEAALDALADHLARHLDIERLLKLAR